MPAPHGAHQAMNNLANGIDTLKGTIDAAINDIVTSHQAGGRAAFDAKVAALREHLSNAFNAVEAMKHLAEHAAGGGVFSVEKGEVEKPVSGSAKVVKAE